MLKQTFLLLALAAFVSAELVPQAVGNNARFVFRLNGPCTATGTTIQRVQCGGSAHAQTMKFALHDGTVSFFVNEDAGGEVATFSSVAMVNYTSLSYSEVGTITISKDTYIKYSGSSVSNVEVAGKIRAGFAGEVIEAAGQFAGMKGILTYESDCNNLKCAEYSSFVTVSLAK